MSCVGARSQYFPATSRWRPLRRRPGYEDGSNPVAREGPSSYERSERAAEACARATLRGAQRRTTGAFWHATLRRAGWVVFSLDGKALGIRQRLRARRFRVGREPDPLALRFRPEPPDFVGIETGPLQSELAR